MNTSFSFSKYSGVAVMAVWTFGWLTAACLAGGHLAASRDGLGIFNLVVAICLTLLGGFVTFRSNSRNQVAETEEKATHETPLRRFPGRLAAIVWCAAAVIWNLSILGCLIKAAREGQVVLKLVMIPFSLIGLFLLLTLFVSLGLVIDFLFGLGKPLRSGTQSTKPSSNPPDIRSRHE